MSLPNLAGNERADDYIIRELSICRIGMRVLPKGERVPRSEVPMSITGFLTGPGGDFTFERAWRYWVVKGRVPEAVAQELYAHPCGVTDVRVAGHCGCPAPEDPWLAYFDEDGVELHSMRDKADLESIPPSCPIYGVCQEQLKTWRFVEERHAEQAFVCSYHIDTEVGLYVFVETLRRHKLV